MEMRRLRRWVWVLVAVLLVVGCAHTAFAQTTASEPDLTTYTGWLREAQIAAERGDQVSFRASAERLLAVKQIRTDKGLISVTTDWLRDMLDKPSDDLQPEADRLAAVIDALSRQQSDLPADARQRLENILNNPPFDQPQQNNSAIRNWLEEFIDWLLRTFFGSPSTASGVKTGFDITGTVISVIGIVLLLAIIIFFLLYVRRNLVAPEAQLRPEELEERMGANTAVDRAGVAAKAGDYRAAVRYMYLSALLWMDEQRLLRYDRTLTNYEYLDRLKHQPDVRARLTPVVDTFDQVWYGNTQPNAESFAEYEKHIAQVRQAQIIPPQS